MDPVIEQLLEYFPEVELPVSLTEETVVTFSNSNIPLPGGLIAQTISTWETGDEEFVEYIPCFKIDGREHFVGIVYWKGELLTYEYILVTFDKQGKMIQRKPISSVHADGSTVKKSVAQIDEDLIIHIMAGESSDEMRYDPSRSQAFNMEIMPTGEIEFMLGQ